MVGKILLCHNYIPGTGLGAHGQGINRPIEVEEYKNRRGLGFRHSCHEIIEARRGKHLHRLAARYGKINRGIPVHPLSYFFPGPPHIVGERFPPKRQHLRRQRAGLLLRIKEELIKQINAEFLEVCNYSEWVANIVPVETKDGRVRVCVNYRDLNKRAMVTLFHDMMHKEIEVYIDDMIAKSKEGEDHLVNLRRLFDRLKKYKLRLNQTKCTFGAKSGKLLGFMVSERGIEVDPDKVKAIRELRSPSTTREVRGFLGRLNYIARFIANLTDKCQPLFRLLLKNAAIEWDEECQKAFNTIKAYLAQLPVLVTPTPNCPLILYLTVRRQSLGCMLGQEVKGQAIADHLAEFLIEDDTPINSNFLDEGILQVDSEENKFAWKMYFDGAVNFTGSGIGAVLISLDGRYYPIVAKVDFPCTNNVAEYEACIIGLQAAIDFKSRHNVSWERYTRGAADPT
ncbi:hypothetical protein CRG98_030029 [Punica granatum]|uniref:G-patch domain-containing protein n=1 Tax=Punica granatum TaxID=22663 RepID=A0A2I0J0N1_PUNGR|nr:hypothetical protein CRG98_030029 [Punica granatum]